MVTVALHDNNVNTYHSWILLDINSFNCHDGRHMFLERACSQDLKTGVGQILALYPGPGGLREDGQQGEPLQAWSCIQISSN